ncbi:MAG: NTP transferase domain-containing protein [candidate division WOR-3 bacterium]|nr:MAG: NTP transferase domain-containing protein [candidate division WOR-3 bacterium]
MNLIIPVAGEGTRLRPHTHSTPKSILYVAGKPILGHIIDSLQGLEISHFSIVLGSQGEAIVDFCNKYPYDFKYVLQEKRLGLGHAIYMGAQGLDGPTLVLLGDTIIDVDYGEFCSGNTNILAVKEVDDPKRFGIVEVKDNDVIDLVEKPKQPRSNLAIVGLYYFNDITKVSAAVEHLMKNEIKTRHEYQLTDALKHMLENGEKFRVMKIDSWYDCGTAQALINTNHHLLHKTQYHKERSGNIIIPPVYIADSAKIAQSVVGPCVSIDEEVAVKNSIISESIINRGATVENALLTESIIGEKARVKGGYKRLNVSESSRVEIP